MAIVEAASIQQTEIRQRLEKFEAMFANDPNVARIGHRFGPDWSGDDSVFVDIVLNKEPSDESVLRLSKEVFDALLWVVRSEELDLHSYFNFVRERKNAQ